ncbi:ABC-three component system middle component 6 [Paenibacillus sp. FSL R7-269]|uniref:ABC-three component system middle component 6 n=1 Tax=Paenibacillus sp. FSL R7-269 TaxID=1226755 RepID=UPI0004B984BB|nr:ABC-three component system middle component 6 [Paenibacillus sp. FSL R7-269]
MLLPNDIKPELSIFYYASLVLKEIHGTEEKEIVAIYQLLKQQYDISLKVFSYCLDWLYLIEAVKVNEEGQISICT